MSKKKENNSLVSIYLSVTEPIPVASPKLRYWVSVRPVLVNAWTILQEEMKFTTTEPTSIINNAYSCLEKSTIEWPTERTKFVKCITKKHTYKDL